MAELAAPEESVQDAVGSPDGPAGDLEVTSPEVEPPQNSPGDQEAVAGQDIPGWHAESAGELNSPASQESQASPNSTHSHGEGGRPALVPPLHVHTVTVQNVKRIAFDDLFGPNAKDQETSPGRQHVGRKTPFRTNSLASAPADVQDGIRWHPPTTPKLSVGTEERKLSRRFPLSARAPRKSSEVPPRSVHTASSVSAKESVLDGVDPVDGSQTTREQFYDFLALQQDTVDDPIPIFPKTARANLERASFSRSFAQSNQFSTETSITRTSSARTAVVALRIRSKDFKESGVAVDSDAASPRSLKGMLGNPVIGYKHPYGLQYPPSTCAQHYIGLGVIPNKSGLMNAPTPRAERGQADLSLLRPHDEYQDPALGRAHLSSRQLTSSNFLKQRHMRARRDSLKAHEKKEGLARFERRARAAWASGGNNFQSVDDRAKRQLKKNATLHLMEDVVTTLSGDEHHLHSLYKAFCIADRAGGSLSDNGSVQGFLELLIQLRLLAYIDMKTGLKSYDKDAGNDIRIEDGLLTRAEVYDVIQSVLTEMDTELDRLTFEVVKRCLQRITGLLESKMRFEINSMKASALQGLVRSRKESLAEDMGSLLHGVRAESEMQSGRPYAGGNPSVGILRKPAPIGGQRMRVSYAKSLNNPNRNRSDYSIRMYGH